MDSREQILMDEEALKSNEKPWLFKKGQKPGPGRPKGSGKSLKEYSKEYLSNMTDDERLEFMDGLPKIDIWKMAEGMPKNDLEVKGKLTISQVLDDLENER